MCTRYYLDASSLEAELEDLIDDAASSSYTAKLTEALDRPLKTTGEMRPSNVVPVVAPSRNGHAKRGFAMSWGFPNPWSKGLLVNARVETAARKPFWRDSWTTRRCAIPASHYFEWEREHLPGGKTRTGQKYQIRPDANDLFYLAGLYRFEEKDGLPIPVFAVLTREPAESIRFIHDRMPLMLDADAVAPWIDPQSDPATIDAIAASALDCVQYHKAG